MTKNSLAIDFEWEHGWAYEIVAPLPASPEDPFAAIDEPHIRQKGKGRDKYRPLEIHSRLYLEFSQLKDATDYLAFAQKWGLLRTRCEDGAQERVSLWKTETRRMRDSIAGLRLAFEEKHPIAMRGANIVPVDVKLIPGKPDGRPTLALAPQTLLDAMRVQLAQNIAGGNQLRTCEQCGGLFESGAAAKRVIARFCHDNCRKEFHRQNRGKS